MIINAGGLKLPELTIQAMDQLTDRVKSRHGLHPGIPWNNHYKAYYCRIPDDSRPTTGLELGLGPNG